MPTKSSRVKVQSSMMWKYLSKLRVPNFFYPKYLSKRTWLLFTTYSVAGHPLSVCTGICSHNCGRSQPHLIFNFDMKWHVKFCVFTIVVYIARKQIIPIFFFFYCLSLIYVFKVMDYVCITVSGLSHWLGFVV